MADALNRQWRLAGRPEGLAKVTDFEWTETPMPRPGPGQALVRNELLSLDPTCRSWMSERETYLPPVNVGDVMRGICVGTVVESNNPALRAGMPVYGMFGWQDYAIVGARVSFRESLAYCRWLTVKLRAATWTPSPLRARLRDGWVITLPSEAEWEKAARGDDGHIYPWGDEFSASRANCGDTGLGATSAVGLFPAGASASGSLDMAGNVWEWTRSLWGSDFHSPSHTYAYEAGDRVREDLQAPDDVLRVLRGGSI